MSLRIFLLSFILSGCALLQAQTLDQAREMIKAGDYPAARNAFSELIKKYPKRADVNKWYGETLFETGEYDEAAKYLQFAAKARIQGAYLYLGKLYQKQYRFEDAIKNLEKYQTFLKKDPAASAAVDSLIEQCELGERALGRIEKVQIIDSMIVDKNKFFQYYKLSQETGKLLDYQLLTAADPDNFSVVFESQRGDRRLFGKQNGTNGYDLYVSNRLHGNDWSEPLPFPENINTAANENFPFVLNDGLTVYYASDMNPTMGGYDLYVTRYNPSNENYFSPERLPMPFNSPFNDYLIAIDEGNNIGWFASDRYQPEDKVILYLFIPNQGEKEYYRDLTPEQAIRLGKVASIQETWQENTAYDQILQAVYATEQEVSRKKGDFVFVINDNILYTRLDEFESSQARELYSQVVAAQKQYAANNTELEQLRLEWTKGNDALRKRIGGKILQLERKTEELQAMIASLELKSRNTEINYLRKK